MAKTSRKRRKLKVLKDFREGRGLTFRAAGAKVGVGGNTWHRWENGERRPDDRYLPKLVKLTGAPLEQLMGLA